MEHCVRPDCHIPTVWQPTVWQLIYRGRPGAVHAQAEAAARCGVGAAQVPGGARGGRRRRRSGAAGPGGRQRARGEAPGGRERLAGRGLGCIRAGEAAARIGGCRRGRREQQQRRRGRRQRRVVRRRQRWRRCSAAAGSARRWRQARPEACPGESRMGAGRWPPAQWRRAARLVRGCARGGRPPGRHAWRGTAPHGRGSSASVPGGVGAAEFCVGRGGAQRSAAQGRWAVARGRPPLPGRAAAGRDALCKPCGAAGPAPTGEAGWS